MMDNKHWQVPGNANPFDSDLKDWKTSYVSQRSIGVLEFIKNKGNVSKKDFENEIWGYLNREFSHSKNNSTIAHFYRPLEFAGLIRRSKNDILNLSIDGRSFLQYVEQEDYDKAKDMYLLQLLKVKYPNSATPKVDLHLFPFRIIFKLFLDDYKEINEDFFCNRINYIQKPSDITDLYEDYSSAYLRGEKFGGNNKWISWVISYLAKWNILHIDKGTKNISLTDEKRNLLKSILGTMSYDEMFYNDENDEIKKRNNISKINRSVDIIKQTIAHSKQKCFLNENHTTFPTRALNNFVEVHHIIPLSLQTSFTSPLDSTDNTIALCPTCHRKVHLSTDEEKAKSLEFIYNNKPSLRSFISSKGDLLEIYCSDFNRVNVG